MQSSSVLVALECGLPCNWRSPGAILLSSRRCFRPAPIRSPPRAGLPARSVAMILKTTGVGICMTQLRDQTISATRMPLNTCAVPRRKQYMNSNIWVCRFPGLNRAEFINDLLVARPRTMAKAGRQAEPVLLPTGQDMRCCIPCIRAI